MSLKSKKVGKSGESRTGNSKRYFVKNGQYFAIPHETGIKSYNLPLRFNAESTYRSAFRRNLFTKAGKKKLVKYDPNAMRNLLKKKYLVGSTAVKKKKRGNESQVEIGDPSNERTRFRTIHRVHYSGESVKLPTGFSNPRIIATKTSWIKKRQLD